MSDMKANGKVQSPHAVKSGHQEAGMALEQAVQELSCLKALVQSGAHAASAESKSAKN